MTSKKDFYKEFNVSEYPLSFDSEEDRLQVKDEIQQRLYQSISNQQASPGLIRRLLTSTTYKIAAVLIVLISTALISYKLYWLKNDSLTFITLNAPQGKVMEFMLPDGSKIILNAGSKLKYPSKFASTRDIYLEEGEAFFDVTHDPSKPFIVHTSNVSTRVLGTAFNVKSYAALPTITVTVERGKVQVNEQAKTLGVLTPDKQLVFSKADHSAINKTVKAVKTTAWKKGDFILTEAYFDEIMLAIANRFNVEMNYDSKVFSNCQNSIHFTKTQTLSKVLETLKEIQGITYSIKGNQVFITGKSCK
ncbi:FecR family protein [Solitalea lacus]|uniref:FecR family protein n=1 Tax=Solitalea lacus TaxID=2911172 RepID=UPI001EDACF3E|nr:FecR family protein [Solitalea lacus]UKJ07515.1 FecR domain-containing protein [Solitalea lacus]